MSDILIFGGTTEGRQLAEFCAANAISCAVSVTTAYAASLLPEGVRVYTGALDCEGMQALVQRGHFAAVVDATHPYAREATANIRQACAASGIRYERLVRQQEDACGEIVHSMEELTSLLNRCDTPVLSTLGSRALPALAGVKDHCLRIWVRMLPAQAHIAEALALGFPPAHLIPEQGPFTVSQNIAHIRQSGAGILLTKESGSIGGYPEKCQAASACGIRLVTLARPQEAGHSLEAVEAWLLRTDREGSV